MEKDHASHLDLYRIGMANSSNALKKERRLKAMSIIEIEGPIILRPTEEQGAGTKVPVINYMY